MKEKSIPRERKKGRNCLLLVRVAYFVIEQKTFGKNKLLFRKLKWKAFFSLYNLEVKSFFCSAPSSNSYRLWYEQKTFIAETFFSSKAPFSIFFSISYLSFRSASKFLKYDCLRKKKDTSLNSSWQNLSSEV